MAHCKLLKVASLTYWLVTGTIALSFSQNNNLCIGNYYTQEDAARVHAEWIDTYTDLSKWEEKKKIIKQGIIIGAELHPDKYKSIPKVILHSKKVLNGYTVENIAIETLPGYYLTGNIYKPYPMISSAAGILCPHGHWRNPDGRWHEQMQNRCASLARMGAIVIAYDMPGYGDSDQSTHKGDSAMTKTFKLQTINSIKALNYLLNIKQVDKNRIAITGASGGGTQTFMLAAIDDRIKVSVPCVQVSAHFFGGCVCESGMPVHKSNHHQTSNVEIASSFSPKPMLIISDGQDWTKNTPNIEFPFIQKIYSLYQSKNVENAHFPNEGHDYGVNKRAAMYRFLSEHLQLDITKADESKNTVLPIESLKVFDGKNKRPDNAVLGDQNVLALLNKW